VAGFIVKPMRAHIIPLALAAFVALPVCADDRVLEPGWSPVVVRVIERGTGRPVVDARIETTCKGSRYEAEHPRTDANGKAVVPVYRTWIALRVSQSGFTNSIVTLVGTNKVAAFSRNAVIEMGRPAR